MAGPTESGEVSAPPAGAGAPDPAGYLPQHIVSALAAQEHLIQARGEQTRALEYDLAVDVALALACFGVSVRELARRSGIPRARLRRLTRMSAR